jgi:hypothetical protein
MSKEKEDAVDDVKAPLFEIELDEATLADVEKSVLEANSGKAKDELTEQIEAAKVARLEDAKKEHAKVLSKMEELSKLEENKGKSEEELILLASVEQPEEEESTDKGEDLLGADFFGVGAREITPKVVDKAGKEVEGAKLPADVQARLDRLEKLEKDDFLKAVLDGEDLNVKRKFAEEIAKSGWAFDPNALTPQVLKAEELRRLKESNPNAISDEEIQDELDTFADKSNVEKIRETSPFKAQIVAEQEKFFESLGTKVSTDVNASKESFKKVVSEAESALKEQFVGNTFFGITVDNERATKVLNAIRTNGISSKKADGTPNVKEAIEKELLWMNRHEILEAAQQRMLKKEARKQAIKQGKPMAGLKIRSAIPKNNELSREAKLRAAQKEANMV